MFCAFSGFVNFNNGNKKMNWVFNTPPISTDWHLNSALTYANAPDSIRGILSSWN